MGRRSLGARPPPDPGRPPSAPEKHQPAMATAPKACSAPHAAILLVLLWCLLATVGCLSDAVVPTSAGFESSSPSGANGTDPALGARVAPSIGAAPEVIDEIGCSDTEFRLTCRELDSTIAILDARFLPSSPSDDHTAPSDTAAAAPPTTATGGTTTEASSSCGPPPRVWLQEEPRVRLVNLEGSAVDDPIIAAENESFPWPLRPDPTHKHFRLAINRRCSGVNHCSFILANDFKEAGQLWGPGVVKIQYACMRQRDRQLLRFCNKEVLAGAPPRGWRGNQSGGGEGFVASPGYPNYYVVSGAGGGAGGCQWIVRPRLPGQRVQVTLLDVSLRGVGPHEQNCSDWLEVSAVATPHGLSRNEDDGEDEERVLLSGCGEAQEAVLLVSPAEAPGLRVALRSSSGTMYPKRGLLFHYKVLGCGWPPSDPPKDGYLVTRNTTAVQYMCCVGFKFPDSGVRQRELRCDEQHGLWHVHELSGGSASEALLPDCIMDGDSILVKRNITKKSSTAFPENSNSSKKSRMKKAWMETDLMFDILIPTIIIGVLLFGNGIIIFIIFQIKKRKLATELQEEELRIAHNGTELTTGKPSDV